VHPPYDHQALWIKSKLFINRALEDDLRSFDERALWASLSLELLAKAALSRVSPLLIAKPNEEGTNLLIASGLVEGEASFESIPAKTLFSRCKKSFRPFDDQRSQQFSMARNEYLHSGGTAFMAIPESAWWPRFWSQSIILLAALDKDVSDYIGDGKVEWVE
jgi:hypothetical protein